MAINTADQYYLKAEDAYGYDIGETIENLNYALSYDEEHIQANLLMAKVLAWEFENWQEAEQYFTRIIAIDPNHSAVIDPYVDMLIYIGKWDKAEKLLHYAISIKGVDRGLVYYRMAIILEKRGQLRAAVKMLEAAEMQAYFQEDFTFIKTVKERVKEKIKLISGDKKTSKKKKKKDQ